MRPNFTLIDGPLPADWPGLVGQEALCAPHPSADHSPAAGHAAAIARAAQMGAGPQATLDSLVVFDGHLASSRAAVTAGLTAAAQSAAPIVLCAFGMAAPDRAMARAVAALLAQGKAVLAAAPAQGAEAYPAALPGVIGVQGDARCGPGEWSRLDLPLARFGAHAGRAGDPVRGASRAVGHFAGHLAAHWPGPEQMPLAEALDQIGARALYQGREHRRA